MDSSTICFLHYNAVGNMNAIIVFGDDFHNTYGVIRSLGEAGIHPYFIDVNTSGNSFVEKSRYIKKSWRVDSPSQGIRVLIDNFRIYKSKPVVICTSDKTIHEIDIRYNELKQCFILPHASAKQGEISRLMQKDVMRNYAKDVGFDLTNSVTVDLRELNFKNLNISNTINYPCLVKPTSSLEGSKSDISVCYTINELKNSLIAISKNANEVEIQDYIRKDVELLLMGCVLRSGEVIMPLYLLKLREDPKLEGSTAWALCKSAYPGFDIRKVYDYLKRVGYYGIFSLEFLVKGDKHYFLEINLRNDGNGYAPTYGGVNLPYIWALDAMGADVSEFKRIIGDGFYAQVELTDYGYLKCKPYKIMKWLIDAFKTECFYVANKKDPKPWEELLRRERFFVRPFHRLLYKFLV